MIVQTAISKAPRFSATDLAERAIYRRAVEAAIWGMPAVNYQLMYQEMVDKVKGDFNQIFYWSKLLDWKNQTLALNPDVINLLTFFNTKAVGPIVLEAPPADGGFLSGSFMNLWHAALAEIGPSGIDKGNGGKYLLLPPHYTEKVPNGYIPVRSNTYQGYALIRSLLTSGSNADVANAIAYCKRLKLYPLSQAANPPETRFVDAAGVVFDSTIRYDVSFFESLDKIIQVEPWLEGGKLIIEQLKTIGIEQGKLFNPDATTRAILAHAMQEVKAYVEVKDSEFAQ